MKWDSKKRALEGKRDESCLASQESGPIEGLAAQGLIGTAPCVQFCVQVLDYSIFPH